MNKQTTPYRKGAVARGIGKLTEEEIALNTEGTWKYPPSYSSLAQWVAFWQNITVPDEVLDDFKQLHDQFRTSKYPGAHARALDEREKWGKANPIEKIIEQELAKTKDPATRHALKCFETSPAWCVRRRRMKNVYTQAFNDWFEENGITRPERIVLFDMRTVYRAWRLWRTLTPKLMVEAEKVVFPMGRGGSGTLKKIARAFHFEALETALDVGIIKPEYPQ